MSEPAEPTGSQFFLQRGEVSAQITSVGASLRALRVGGVDVVPPYPAHTPTPLCAGVVLVPWPNRIRDGRWQRDDGPQQLALTEPDRANAIHGLLRYTPYAPAHRDDESVELAATVYPQPGYRFQLDTRVRYALGDRGITVTHTIVNVGAQVAPVAVGAHPFLTIGGVDPGDLELTIAAATHYPTDERMLPTAPEPVDGTAYDLRAGRRLGGLQLDDGFGAVHRGDDGLARHTLRAPDGRRLELWCAPGFDFVQVFTTAAFPGQAAAVAIEPMTAPADAFNSGTGLRWLAAGEQAEWKWGIVLHEAPTSGSAQEVPAFH